MNNKEKQHLKKQKKIFRNNLIIQRRSKSDNKKRSSFDKKCLKDFLNKKENFYKITSKKEQLQEKLRSS